MTGPTPLTARRRVGVLISGRGSNMEALIEAAKGADYPADIVLVLANQPDAGGLATAAAQGITTVVVDHRPFKGDRAAFEEAIDARLRQEGVEFVCLAGFMRVLTPSFVTAWRGRLINIHPSLLPALPGLHTHERALAAGMRLHGCTVHFVSHELDAGPIIAQAAVPVRFGDTADTLAARVLAAEHRLYPRALALVAAGRATLAQDRVIYADAQAVAEASLTVD
ncbi:phosphoribosylglycinamide formyltransferase [Chelatococcus reniformis]|uniref:Phosphoribosylglycinamide formyltransferase n=1 Tax=Chelatococcus reniformis TaxID=1494448 RepID=A0A916UFM0_9HYPH|nr:phosphoribosylglycinamide formyltransferase [Chelatococcus reniformis]GGC69201.1 phosphoribosylglycinamide formyltransferase [Chelatococcus reniformis]